MSDPILVKVCGVTSEADAVACANAGADWIGLNFHPPSPRHIVPRVAREIMSALPISCQAVGLFVDRPPAEILDIACALGLQIVQLHGDEPPEDLIALGNMTIVRAFRIRDAAAIARMTDHLARAATLGREPDAVLVDAFVPGQAGGTGHVLPERLLELLPGLPRLILAGGLTPGNVAERVSRLRPWMVDVASGVESSPGRKDPTLVAAFIRAARSL